jgi:hypothetical protein
VNLATSGRHLPDHYISLLTCHKWSVRLERSSTSPVALLAPFPKETHRD